MTDRVETPFPPLSIGVIIGGMTVQNRDWDQILSALSIRVRNLREGRSSSLNLNVVFHVPGHFHRADFEGSRTGSYFKRDRCLMVQVALPEVVPENVNSYLQVRLDEAIAVAEAWVRRKRIEGDLAAQREIIALLAKNSS